MASPERPLLPPVPMFRRTGLLASVALVIVATAAPLTAQGTTSTPTTPPAKPADAHHHHMEGLPPVKIPPGAIFTEADVRFMQGMIAHHAQAIYMSKLATDRGASPRLLKLATKIDLSQAGEIVLMQEWLVANGQFAPDTSSWRTMQMAGMLTADEMQQLEAARGAEFDRQYLLMMIRHHEGALRMVADLLATPRAAQDVDVNVFANEVEAVQTAEIGVMRQLLRDM